MVNVGASVEIPRDFSNFFYRTVGDDGWCDGSVR